MAYNRQDKSVLLEIIIALFLIGFLILFLSPIDLLMPMTTGTMSILLVAVLFMVFSSLVFREKSRDERENVLKMNAGRISFLAGSIIAVIGILYQSTTHNIDPWLVYTLIGMILAKTTTRLYSSYRS